MQNDIHIIYANLQVPPENYWPLLSKDEQQRAERFKYAKHKNRFIVSRGILREILADFLNENPEKIQFYTGKRGKPYLKNTTLEFNLSHSAERAVYAIRDAVPIGIDIEYTQKNIEMLKLAKRFFAEVEYNNLLTLESREQRNLFFNYWTAKEAYIKTVGGGLFSALHDFIVVFDDKNDSAHIKFKEKNTPPCYLKLITIENDYQIAVATLQPMGEIKIKQLI